MKFLEAIEMAKDRDQVKCEGDPFSTFLVLDHYARMWTRGRPAITQLHPSHNIPVSVMLSDKWKIVRETRTTEEFK